MIDQEFLDQQVFGFSILRQFFTLFLSLPSTCWTSEASKNRDLCCCCCNPEAFSSISWLFLYVSFCFFLFLQNILYLMNLGFNLPKSPYGPFFWLFIIATLVLIIAVNVGRYQNPLEEPIGISSRLAPKNLESTFLNFIVLLLYGLSVASYHLYWKKYVHSKLPLICLNFLIKLY